MRRTERERARARGAGVRRAVACAVLAVAAGLPASAKAQDDAPELTAEVKTLVQEVNQRIDAAAENLMRTRLQGVEELEAFAAEREGTEDAAFALLVAADKLMGIGRGDLAEPLLERALPQAGKGATRNRIVTYLARLRLDGGMDAPEFSAKTLGGREIGLKDFRGKLLLVDFWATWCPPCIDALPQLKAVNEKYRKQGLQVLSVSVDEDLEALRRFVRTEEMSWIHVADRFQDGGEPISAKYGVIPIPHMVLIGPDGKILDYDVPIERLDGTVAKALEDKD